VKNCTAVPPPVVVAPPPAPAPTPAPAPAPKLTLPAGTQEAALLAFVRDSAAQIDKAKWFDFPEIMFDVAKSDIKPESEAKLNAVLSVLKEYPAVKLKVGGYTDTDGNDKANLKLSDDRAKACQAWLIAKGVAADRLEAEGYGEGNPVAPNDTPENKAKNRRISFSVRAK
jgi:OOP family OmpA-OmpF porin